MRVYVNVIFIRVFHSHIGISATEDEGQHVVLVKNALFFSLNELGYDFKVTLNNPNSRL